MSWISKVHLTVEIFQSEPKQWTEGSTDVTISTAMLLVWPRIITVPHFSLDQQFSSAPTSKQMFHQFFLMTFNLFTNIPSLTDPQSVEPGLEAVAPHSLWDKSQFSFPIRMKWVIIRGWTCLFVSVCLIISVPFTGKEREAEGGGDEEEEKEGLVCPWQFNHNLA